VGTAPHLVACPQTERVHAILLAVLLPLLLTALTLPLAVRAFRGLSR